MTSLPRALLVLFVVLAGCKHGEPSPSHHGQAHWTYEGEAGPGQWGHLSAEFAACSEGKHQSPIDLGTAAREELPALVLEYQPAPLALENNGHTIQEQIAPGSALVLDGKRYELKQFHFHAPSEHAVNGVRFPMELHLVHQSPEGALAVVGLFLSEGGKNAALAPVFEGMGGGSAGAANLDLAALLPADKKYVSYPGSLTTPPCTEGVQWFVLNAPSEISREQLSAFTALFPNNSRPVMPVNDRKVVSVKAP